jgi:hypothetical protein
LVLYRSNYDRHIARRNGGTNVLRAGARQLLAQAVDTEVETFLSTVEDLRLADGRARVVRHGYPARAIQTGIGPVEVARAKIRDPGGGRRWRAEPVQLGNPGAARTPAHANSRTDRAGWPIAKVDALMRWHFKP